ncbi:MAG: hypothetical protein AB1673_05295 [Actinomycetota bacterium]
MAGFVSGWVSVGGFSRRRREAFLRRLASAVVVLLGLSTILASSASGVLLIQANADFPDSVVGQTFPAGYAVSNFSTPPQSVDFPNIHISQIDLYPACTQPTTDCIGGTPEAGVYALSATGVGQSIPAGNATCEGTWTITPNTGNTATATSYRLTPPGGEGTLVLSTGNTCTINFTATALRVPTTDVQAAPGVQTYHSTGVTPSSQPPQDPFTFSRTGQADFSTVGQGPTEVTTVAGQGAATPGTNLGTTTDTATLSPVPPNTGAGATPTGTITFNLYGPNDPTCAGAPFNTQQVVVTGFGDHVTPTPVPITQAGTYIWVAAYSGDANYAADANACGEPLETVTFAPAQPNIVTQAVTPVTVGSPISDTATLSNGVNPTGTITFTLFGPGDPTCASPAIFTDTVTVNGNGNYTSDPFTPTLPGEYQWVAVYSGDANNLEAISPCGAPNETSVVNAPVATVVTNATPTANLGEPITDVATVSGPGAPAPNPTGTVTFTVYGPNDPTCAGPVVFTSANRPLAGGPPPTATSEPFTPTLPGDYEWVAVYNGDAVYAPVTSPCGAPNETSTVLRPVATIVTNATPTVTIGGSITDVATVSGPGAPAPNPTGTVTFTVFGPNDAACTGPAVFTSANRPLAGGPPPTATSEAFTPTAVGTYRWVAVYNGDAVYLPATSPCNAPNESSVVTQAEPTLVTLATQAGTVGSPISDTATLSGGVNPTGTITFTLFGPDDATCAGPAVFTSVVAVDSGNGDYVSGDYVPTAPGSYRWVADYSGDANNAPANSPCNAPGEITAVDRASPLLTTEAVEQVTLTQPISDTATLAGGVATPPAAGPTGTITFTLYGPNDAACAGPVAFTSTVPVNGNGNYNSGNFTPTAVGSYNWVAEYSGDANNAPALSPCGAPNETSIVTALPTVQVVKTANPTTMPEPGGPVTYSVVVTNTSTDDLTITSLTDDIYGDITTRPGSTCTDAIGTVLASGANYPCQFTADFTGNAGDSLTDVVTVVAENPDGVEATDDDDATVTLTDVLPTVLVDKTANPLTRPEPGGTFTFTVVVTNTSVEDVTVLSLTDSIYGDLTTLPGSTCGPVVGSVLAPGASSPPCTFTADFTGGGGDTETNTVTVVVEDDEGNEASDSDDATITLTDVLPTITVDKTADPLVMPEPGGTFTFTVVVTNTSIEPVTLTTLTDDIYGNLNGQGTCATGGVIAANGGTYSCSFPGDFFGGAGDIQTDVVTAVAVDDEGNQATDSDDATVSILNVVPQIVVTKDADPSSLPEPGGTFTFSVLVVNNSIEDVTITSITDDIYGNLNGQGTCATGAVLASGESYSCEFEGDFFGNAGDSQTDVVTVTAVDDDGSEVSDSDDATVTITDVLPTIDVDKTASPISRPEPGGPFTYTVVVTNTSIEAVTITSLTDDVYGDVTTRSDSTCTDAIGTVLAPGASYTCQFVATFTGDAGASLTDTVTAVAVDDDGSSVTASDDATVFITDVPPTVTVDKTASPPSRPEPGGTFTFGVVVTNTSIEPVTITSLTDDIYGDLNGRGTCAIGAVLQPGASYACSFTGVFTGNAGDTQTDIVTVVVVDNEGTSATDSDTATVTITDVPPTVTLTKTANPTSLPEPGGTFTFTVVVTNTSNEAVTITSLVDDIYGNLNGRGTCAIGVIIPAGSSYTCAFQGSFLGGGGDTQTDVVTVVVTDDDGSTATASDTATVTITDVLPTVSVTKTADPTSRPAPGGPFTFTVRGQLSNGVKVANNSSTNPC